MLKKLFLAFVFVAFASTSFLLWYLLDLPDTAKLKTENPRATAIRTFREEQFQAKGRKPASRMEWRSLNQISPYLRHAVVLAEDDTFFTHRGFDLEQLKRAIQVNWERKKFAFGASTITQQLARTIYLSPRKSLLRKAKEALITRKMEQTLTKNRILELYLNTVEWGPQIYGIEAAAQHFYAKPASDLSVDEAISLAVILPSPRRFNPLSEKGFIASRKKILYERMVRANYVPAEPVAEPIPIGEPTPEVAPENPSLDEDDEPVVEEEPVTLPEEPATP